MPEFIIGCVGKPSAGKSTYFNAVCASASAKVGNFPFTTIEPNQGIAHVVVKCPCKRLGVQCKPNFGYCIDGRRRTPVKMLDVAGLIPGASEGLGLGNKFLDDLRHADVLLHILDVSGTTNEKGEQTTDYNPAFDHAWLLQEVSLWIFNNLWKKWPSLAKRHIATKSTASATLQAQFSGYGSKEHLVRTVLEEVGVKQGAAVDFLNWDHKMVMNMVEVFVKLRFKFILVLNKADSGGNTDKNALKLLQTYGEDRTVMCSALAECFLRKMREQKYITYEEGQMDIQTPYDEAEASRDTSLKMPDEKLKHRIERIRDLVLYRYESTGVQQALNLAMNQARLVPVFPVRSMARLRGAQDDSSPIAKGHKSEPLLPECMLIPQGTTIGDFAGMLHREIEKNFMYAEGPDGKMLGLEDLIDEDHNVIRIVTSSSTAD